LGDYMSEKEKEGLGADAERDQSRLALVRASTTLLMHGINFSTQTPTLTTWRVGRSKCLLVDPFKQVQCIHLPRFLAILFGARGEITINCQRRMLVSLKTYL
jgi:hypothetical protein